MTGYSVVLGIADRFLATLVSFDLLTGTNFVPWFSSNITSPLKNFILHSDAAIWLAEMSLNDNILLIFWSLFTMPFKNGKMVGSIISSAGYDCNCISRLSFCKTDFSITTPSHMLSIKCSSKYHDIKSVLGGERPWEFYVILHFLQLFLPIFRRFTAFLQIYVFM